MGHSTQTDTLQTDRQVAAKCGTEHYVVTVRAGNHSLTADEPESAGGQDQGPSPYDYLLAGLGACIVMTVRMYADRKEWPVEAITVHLSHEKVASDGEDGGGGSSGKVDQIECTLEVEGDLTEEQRGRIVEIAGKCPVHRTLTGPVRISMDLAET
jgi:uncharacterized OsmC-like protein